MIISVSSDKNLRFSQLLGGAVGPNVVIGQFESTGDVNKMMFSTRSKTVKVCLRGSWWWKPLGSLSSRATAPHRRQSSALHQSLSTFWSSQQSLAWLSFSIISSAEDGGTTWIMYIKVGKRRQDCLLSKFSSPPPIPWVNQDRRSRNHLSVLHPFASLFSSDNFFSYFVLAFLNILWWPIMNWC